VRSVVITGEGAHFCAGGNLQRLLGNRQQPPEVQAESIERPAQLDRGHPRSFPSR
jgi:enoyl-CoA hydratase/carnithine racemase